MPVRLSVHPAICTSGFPGIFSYCYPYFHLTFQPLSLPAICTSNHLPVRSSVHPEFCSSDLLPVFPTSPMYCYPILHLALQSLCFLVMDPSGLLAVRSSGHLLLLITKLFIQPSNHRAFCPSSRAHLVFCPFGLPDIFYSYLTLHLAFESSARSANYLSGLLPIRLFVRSTFRLFSPPANLTFI